jgi:hypothetical protein
VNKEKYETILEKMEETNPDAVILEGYDNCVVGICNTFSGAVLLYSEDKIIEKLMSNMTEEKAIEFYEYNILNAYYGQYSPVFLVSEDDL